MSISFTEVVTSIMRGVSGAVQSMSGFEIVEIPEVKRENISNFIIFVLPESFVSSISFCQQGKARSKGIVVVYISDSDIKTLFGKELGLDLRSERSEIRDACGELCNIIAGGFKREISMLGKGAVEISVPKNYREEVRDEIDIDVNHKYRLTFSKDGLGFIMVDLAMETPR